jgi:hypothetical protein
LILILLEKVPAALFDLWGGVREIKGSTRLSGVKPRNHRMQSKNLIITITQNVSGIMGNMRNGTLIITVYCELGAAWGGSGLVWVMQTRNSDLVIADQVHSMRHHGTTPGNVGPKVLFS